MPVATTYPGVYIEELPSGVRTISNVATSITAFVGYTARGLDNRAKRLFSFADFERNFGGLASDSELSYAVAHFFDNGGGEAYVVRVPKNDAVSASVILEDKSGAGAKDSLTLTALSKGAWANQIIIDVDYAGIPSTDTNSFNLTITDLGSGTVETFSNVTMDNASSKYVEMVVNDRDNGSQLVTVSVGKTTPGRPVETGFSGSDIDLTKLKNDQDYKIEITIDSTGKAADEKKVEVLLIRKGEALPTSITGLCRLLERNINVDFEPNFAAHVRCVPSNTGKGIRLLCDFRNGSHDARFKLADKTTGALKLIGVDPTAPDNVIHYWLGSQRTALAQKKGDEGKDGVKLPQAEDLIGNEAAFTGIYALDKVDLFNILCIPDATRAKASDPNTLDDGLKPNDVFGKALTFCEKKRAFLLIDPEPKVRDVDSATDWKTSGLTVRGKNAAAYFPRVRVPDPLNNFQLRTFAPCGIVAGLYARTDVERGVWKAPAGTDASLRGAQGLVYKLNDPENGALNPLGLNCLRNFPVYGHVAWGARTLVGADAEASEWKYVPVRRLALFIEESLYRGTKWVVFEPNDEPLWAQIRLNLGAFMQSLFLQGAFQGKTPREAYLVRCDKTTTTQNDIDRGIVNIVVGFAPLKPAEFVIIKIQQLAGQTQA